MLTLVLASAALAVADGAPPAPPAPGVSIVSTVFSEGLGGTACYRIPSVVQTGNGTIVAFAEARHGSCSDGAVHAIATRRSTDKGKTWSAVTNAVGGDDFYVGNPDAVVTKSGKIVLLFVLHSPKCEADCGVGNGMVVSTDGGISWSKPVDVSKQWGKAAGSLPGPGVALQTTSGRILAVSHHEAYEEDYVTISDDDGATWKVISTIFPKMDEAQITQLPNGNLMLNMRHQKEKELGRGVAFSTDDGDSWSPISYEKALTGSVCQGSTVSFGGVAYFSNPANSIGRFNTTVRSSIDNGKTWGAGLLIEAAPSAGYSCLVKGAVEPGVGGILFESANMTIQFAQFPLTKPPY